MDADDKKLVDQILKEDRSPDEVQAFIDQLEEIRDLPEPDDSE